MKIQIGKCKGNLFVILPEEAAAQLDWGSGDIIDIQVVDGELKIVRTMTAHDRAMGFARDAMERYRETFETLAKS